MFPKISRFLSQDSTRGVTPVTGVLSQCAARPSCIMQCCITKQIGRATGSVGCKMHVGALFGRVAKQNNKHS